MKWKLSERAFAFVKAEHKNVNEFDPCPWLIT